MSDENTVYYIAAGKSLEAIKQWQKELPEVNAKRADYFKSISVQNGWTRTGARNIDVIFGILVGKGETVPDGFRKSPTNPNAYVPDKRTAIGKRRSKELSELDAPRLDIGNMFIHGARAYWPGFETHGDKFIISQHKNAPPPPDAVPMKRSEYWAMKEAEEKPVE